MSGMAQFCRAHRITIRAHHVDHNPNAPLQEAGNHWHVYLVYRVRRFAAYYSQGAERSGAPTAARVLSGLQADAVAESMTFDQWADAFGYDSDSRRAASVYKACVHTGRRLKRWLGPTLFAEYLRAAADPE